MTCLCSRAQVHHHGTPCYASASPRPGIFLFSLLFLITSNSKLLQIPSQCHLLEAPWVFPIAFSALLFASLAPVHPTTNSLHILLTAWTRGRRERKEGREGEIEKTEKNKKQMAEGRKDAKELGPPGLDDSCKGSRRKSSCGLTGTVCVFALGTRLHTE